MIIYKLYKRYGIIRLIKSNIKQCKRKIKRKKYIYFALIIAAITLYFSMYIFIFKFNSNIGTLLVSSIVATLCYCAITLHKLKDNNNATALHYFNLSTKEEGTDNNIYVIKNINTSLEFAEKFATVSALITFTLFTGSTKFDFSLDTIYSILLSFITTIMYFHYFSRFLIYCIWPADNKIYNYPTLVVYMILSSKCVFICLYFGMTLALGLEFANSQKLFCHTDNLIKLNQEFFGNHICDKK